MAIKKIMKISGETFFVAQGMTKKTADLVVDKEAYIKVVSVSGTKNEASANVEAKTDIGSSYSAFVFIPNMDGPNFIKQAYEHMKTLPEYSGAQDC
jgi:hypothetical protein